MRIVVTSAPKSGNHWLKCILAHIYGLEWFSGDQTAASKAKTFSDWVARGGFPDGTILHHHARFSRALADVTEAAPASIATIVRNPYDVFVSLHAWVQDRVTYAHHFSKEQRPRPRDVMIGKPLDHPDVLRYLDNHFGVNLAAANDWLHSGRAAVVRYEHLHRDPEQALSTVVARLGPASSEQIAAAIEQCRAENMRQMNELLAWHVRTATVGESKECLSEAHLKIFRQRHAALVGSLGYEVR